MKIISLAWGGRSTKALYEENLQLREELARVDLDHARHIRDLINNFSVALDTPDEDALRDGLSAALSDLNDHVARLEEHSGI
jgi:hypothetical protein